MTGRMIGYLVLALGAWLFAALALLDIDPARALHIVDPCSVTQSSGINTVADPDAFVATGLIKCHPPGDFPRPPDELGVLVFWEYVEWQIDGDGHWRLGGLYDNTGCLSCIQLTSRTNDNVPMGAFYGLNCRRASAVLRNIEHFLGGLWTWEYYTPPTMSAKCQ